ncbi:MAG: beta-lactamase family protein [Alphaproteobacteria bacterium]|nr:beta-lactamase family protein [Alphaproteobacteria bacterium]
MNTLPILLILLACASPGLDPELEAALQDTLDQERDRGEAPGATLAVYISDQGTWAGASGMGDLSAEVPTAVDDRFKVGSITKTFVATVVLQLVAEEALDLDAPLAEVLPDAPHASEVTPRQLLNHTAGYVDYVTTLTFLGSMDQERTPEELIALIADEPLQFEPGTAHSYSNTHFALLGMAIEAVTGGDYAAQVRARALEPVGLSATFVPSDQPVEGRMAHGYLGEGYDPQDVTDALSPTGPWAAGEMVSTAEDLVLWGRALYGGEVLTAAQLDAMTTDTALPDGSLAAYGLGCQIEDVEGLHTVGHSGSTHGYQSRLRYAETDDGRVIVMATLVNNFLAEADTIDAAAWAVVLRY